MDLDVSLLKSLNLEDKTLRTQIKKQTVFRNKQTKRKTKWQKFKITPYK